MPSLPSDRPPRYRILYTLTNGQQRFSQAFDDHEFADRWAKLIRLAQGVTHAEVVTVDPSPSVCPWCGQTRLPLDEAHGVCPDCDRFIPAVDLPLPPALRAA
jgi:hypothetical protein